VGDLGEQTAVEPVGEGRFRATLSADWEIWGPMGGYVAAHALRAVGASTPHPRPVSFSCHYLGVAAFAPIDIMVEARKEGRAASSHRVSITQEERPILEALVWSAAENEGQEHDETVAPDVPGPAELPSISELVDPEDQPPFAFWRNLDGKPLQFREEWPPPGPEPAVWKEWLRFVPTASYADEWVDAARSVILVDLPSWPAANRPHAWKQEGWTAPTLDLNVAFHRPAVAHEWLLCDGTAPLATAGLFGWTARVWGEGGVLLSSGGGQCLYRRPRG
jgi:acyl-CoA thioesterase-2